jgi:hypothetical protein
LEPVIAVAEVRPVSETIKPRTAIGATTSAANFFIIFNPFLGFDVSKHYYVFSAFLTVPKNGVKIECWHYSNRGTAMEY